MSLHAEHNIRSALESGDTRRAVTLLLDAYGSELQRYLGATLSDTNAAREAFALLTEDLWRGLPEFGWRCSVRTWAYVLARNCRARWLADEARKRSLHAELRHLQWPRPAGEARPPTPLHLRSEVKVRMRELRSRLSEEEQTLLVLRVDQGLSWNELARVFDAEARDPESLARAAARLRQRFQKLKERLRSWAVEASLLEC